MMRFKNMLKCFSKTEVQEDERFPLAPMREREELLCERSELSNSGEGYISCAEHTVTVFSPFTSHFSQLYTPHPSPLPQGAREQLSCAKHTVKVFSPFTSHFSQLYTPHPSPLPQGAREQLSCAKHTEKNLFTYLPIHLFTFKKCALTLAEVLITLAIIGVVAAMTLPTLIQKQEKRALEVATQKFYSTMSQAIRQYMADEGVDDLRNTPLVFGGDNWETDEIRAQKEVDEFFKKYLKAQICENGCFAKNYKTQMNEVSVTIGTEAEGDYYIGRYLLPDGMVVGSYDGYYIGSTTLPGAIYVDVNGQKGPNKIGYDLWSMSVFYDGTLDESGVTPECKKGGTTCWTNHTLSEIRQDRFKGCTGYGYSNSDYGGCFGHFLENNFKFDY